MLSQYLFGKFNEADVDGVQPVDNNDTEDYTQEGQPQQQASQDGGQQDSPANDAQQVDNPDAGDPGADEGDPEDYTQEGDPQDGGDQGGQDAGGAPQGDSDQPVADDARGLENQLFSDLTPQQLNLKHEELKNNFVKLFDNTGEIIDRINEVPTDERFLSTMNFISTQLSELRERIVDYMNNVYSTKSYMENSIVYNRFLTVLNQINQVLAEIKDDIGEKDSK